MSGRRVWPALDSFRLAAALLVVAIHCSPLASCSPAGDFLLTRVLARVAVPFFLMTSGHFAARSGRRDWRRLWKKTALLYALAVLLYLPLNIYAGQLTGGAILRGLLLDGTFYHLWYFPALLLGLPIARGLRRLGRYPALCIAAVLYLIGLGGDSYYGFAAQSPALARIYGLFFQLFSYSRNGLFYVPLFLLLGADVRPLGRRRAGLGLTVALAAMTAEAFWLRAQGVQRHDSMYLLLPVVMWLLFSLLLQGRAGERRDLRRISMLVYLLHPWCIVLVRGAGKLTGLAGPLVTNSLGHFFAVTALSLALAWLLWRLRPLPVPARARAWRELNLPALGHNVQALEALLTPGQKLMAVVKADAYGHGAVPVARYLNRRGVRAFGVACLSEGIALRKAGVRGLILILGYTDPSQTPALRRWRLTQTVADAAHGRALAAVGRGVRVHLALDTGMHRLGIPAEDTAAIGEMFCLKGLRVDGVFSHLCASDSLSAEDVACTRLQLERFYGALARLRDAGLDPGAIHIQASYGLLNLPPQPCTYARIGIALYGLYSDGRPTRMAPVLQPVLSLRTRVAAVRTLHAGQTAGYGQAFRVPRETRLATVTIGYADGLPRNLPALGGEVLIRGRRCPMVGRMCMDQLLVDVTEMPQVCTEDVVTLIGADGDQRLRGEALASRCGTITNELFSRLGARLQTVVCRSAPEIDAGVMGPEKGAGDKTNKAGLEKNAPVG